MTLLAIFLAINVASFVKRAVFLPAWMKNKLRMIFSEDVNNILYFSGQDLTLLPDFFFFVRTRFAV